MEEVKEEVKHEEEKKDVDLGEEEPAEIVFKAGQLAPLIDRVGRLMVDFSPHLNQIVVNHHQRQRRQQEQTASQPQPPTQEEERASGGLFSNLRFLRSSINTISNMLARRSEESSQETAQ